MRVNTVKFVLSCVMITTGAWAQPVINAVVNGASGQVNASPGCLVTAWGTGFAETAMAASPGALPFSLGGVTVSVGGISAPLEYVGPEQINFQIPFEVDGAVADVVVSSGGQSSSPFSIRLSATSPGIFRADPGHALVMGSDFKVLKSIRSLQTIVFYAVGLGQTNPPAGTGVGGADAEPLNRLVRLPMLKIGGIPATIQFAGMAPGYPGVYQINAVVPDQPETDEISLTGSSGVGDSSVVLFNNGRATVSTATVSYVYPKTSSQVGFWPMPVVLSLNVVCGVNYPSGGQYKVVALVEGSTAKAVFNVYGGFVANVPPARVNWDGVQSEPSASERSWDFSKSGFGTLDFLSGLAFPGQIVPLSRVDPDAQDAVSQLSFMTSIGGGAPLPPQATIRTRFGGYVSLPGVPDSSLPLTARIYVDGVLVATQSIEVNVTK